MTQRILAVGCSFTAGHELADPLQAWPYQLGQRLGGHVTNLARPAAANTHIVRTIAEQRFNYDVFLIGWTGYDRTELADEQGVFTVWPGRPVQPGDRAWVSRYVTINHDYHYLYRSYLVNCIAVESMLTTAGARWVMIDAFLNDTAPERQDPEFEPLLSQIDRQYWVPGNMSEWCQNLPHGPGGHPLAQGHARTAEIIYENALHLRT